MFAVRRPIVGVQTGSPRLEPRQVATRALRLAHGLPRPFPSDLAAHSLANLCRTICLDRKRTVILLSPRTAQLRHEPRLSRRSRRVRQSDKNDTGDAAASSSCGGLGGSRSLGSSPSTLGPSASPRRRAWRLNREAHRPTRGPDLSLSEISQWRGAHRDVDHPALGANLEPGPITCPRASSVKAMMSTSTWSRLCRSWLPRRTTACSFGSAARRRATIRLKYQTS